MKTDQFRENSYVSPDVQIIFLALESRIAAGSMNDVENDAYDIDDPFVFDI